MIDRIHGHTAHCWADTSPTRRAGFTERAQGMLIVADFADGRPAIERNFPDFPGP
jgi:hypothetical protein